MTETSYCRLCAELTSNDNLITVIDSVECNQNLVYKIFECFRIQIQMTDNLPKYVCSECCKQVLITYEFSEKIRRSQNILTNIFNQLDDKSIKLEWNGSNDQLNDVEQKTVVKSEESSGIIHDADFDYSLSHFDDDTKHEIFSDLEDSDTAKKPSPAKRVTRKSKKSKNKSLDVSKIELKKQLKEIIEEWKNYIWVCNLCKTEFQSVKELRDHYGHEHDKPVQYTCMECSKVYNKYDLFKRHVRAHRNKHKYQCDVCGKYSYNKSLHEQHIIKHSIDRKFMCSTCGKSFKTQNSLTIHGRMHLPDEQKSYHECDVCHKKFSTGPNLSSHKKIHTGLRQYTCDQCGRTFIQKINLENHIISRHTDDHPCHCPLCPKVFKNLIRLRKHQEVHSDIKRHECKICGKKYRRSSDLKVHNRIHSGELPYECEYCKKCFRMKKFLQVHVRQHTGERPYSCIDCNHHFANSSNYIKHMKAKHGVSSFKNLTTAHTNKVKFEPICEPDLQYVAALQKNIL